MSDSIDLWQIVEKDLEKQTGSLSKNVSYLEYYSDILGLILKEMVSILPPESITPQLQAKVNILSTILEHSSIDLSNISSPLEIWKVGGIIDLKKINTELREMYISAKMSGV